MKYSSIKSTLSRAAIAFGVIGVLAHAVPASAADAIPTQPEAGTFKLGIEPWLGYGQWHVAAAKGFFKAAKLDDVELVNFTEDKDLNAALASGQLDAANIATHTAMAMVAAGLPVKIVSLLDFSLSADAILAGSDIKTVADLKGKDVAYEEGTTSDILLNYALASNGMTISDINKVPMPAADAGSALIAGRVPVAVTYEPYISSARAQGKNVQILFAAGEDPGPRLRRVRRARGCAEVEARPGSCHAEGLGSRPCRLQDEHQGGARHHRQGRRRFARGPGDRVRRRPVLLHS
jgi:NitT/TauT family transport system substrate-binding protein